MSEIYKINAYETYKLLLKYENNISGAPLKIVSACKSQGALAKLDMQDNKIVPVSLNNLKNWSNIVVEDGGWDRIENLRSKIFKESKKKKNDETVKKTNEFKVNELKDCLNKSERERLSLERAYFELFEILRNHAIKTPKLRFQLDRHTAMFSMKRHLSIVKMTGEDR